jgi:D-sedoheptulose 7-phosphate isomerase
MNTFIDWQKELAGIISNVSFTDESASQIGAEEGYAALLEIAGRIMQTERRLYFIGNGASAAMASHIAADMGKNGKLKTSVFTDLALLTAIVNDLGGENIFAAPLRTQARRGDALVVISSSGNSINLIRAVEVARDLGLKVITFTAMSPSNKLRSMGDINVWIPAPTYGYAESAHAAILHYWVDNVVEKLSGVD